MVIAGGIVQVRASSSTALRFKRISVCVWLLADWPSLDESAWVSMHMAQLQLSQSFDPDQGV